MQIKIKQIYIYTYYNALKILYKEEFALVLRYTMMSSQQLPKGYRN